MTDIFDDESPKQPTPAEIEEKRFLKFLGERGINSREELYKQTPERKCEIGDEYAHATGQSGVGRETWRSPASGVGMAPGAFEALSPEAKIALANEITARKNGWIK
jgi:hypothetical protein